MLDVLTAENQQLRSNGDLQLFFSPTDFTDFHRFLVIFLAVSRKKRNFGGRIKCLKGEDYGNRY